MQRESAHLQSRFYSCYYMLLLSLFIIVLYVVRSVLVYSNRARSSALPGYIRFEECVVCEWTEAQLVPALRRKAN